MWMWQMRRWGGSRFRRGVVTRKQTGAHYLIESTGLDLDAASEWQTRVPIVKVAVTRTFFESVLEAVPRWGEKLRGTITSGSTRNYTKPYPTNLDRRLRI